MKNPPKRDNFVSRFGVDQIGLLTPAETDAASERGWEEAVVVTATVWVAKSEFSVRVRQITQEETRAAAAATKQGHT